MYDEDDLLPLSAVQHLAFCERQCALIHVEGAWDENHLTALGRVLHERTHDGRGELRDGIVTARSLALRSLRLGLSGVADVVEFLPVAEGGVCLTDRPGRWQPFPVEYKRGKPKPDRCDEVQVCAQALCLEEMLGATIAEAALYYGEPRRRTPVTLSAELRAETERLATRLHELVRGGQTPPAVAETRCRSCSLLEQCLPASRRRARSAGGYLHRMIQAAQQPLGVTSDEADA
jgi:CRISPR-associated exonuclease Cas4